MRALTLLFSALFLISLSLPGCKKYEDGPGLSFRSKEKRLAHEWLVIEVGEDYKLSESELQGTFTFTEDGGVTVSNLDLTDDELTSYAGEWLWVQNEERLNFFVRDEYDDLISYDFEVRRLTNKELWLMETEFGDGNRLWKLEAQ